MKRFAAILCVVAPDEASQVALERATTLAKSNQTSLTVVTVTNRLTAGAWLRDGSVPIAELQEALVAEREHRLEALVEPYRARIRIEARVLVGVPFLEVIRYAQRSSRDLIVKAPENPEWLDRLFGSDDMHLLRKCRCPVWMVKPQAATACRRILTAIDANDDYPSAEQETRHALNLEVLDLACSIVLAEFAELHVVYVWDAIGENLMRGGFVNMPESKVLAYVEQVRLQQASNTKRLIDEATEKLGHDVINDLKPQTHLIKGWAKKGVPALARKINADLIVMGTIGRVGIPGFVMGNTAESILTQIDCSVLAIKPPGFVTPVTQER